MGWIDRYRQAEFRNIKFYIPNVEGQGGRRNVVHELPERDTPFVQDLGRKGRRFSIEAYVIGENYDIQRDSLITVLERKGSGKLIHQLLIFHGERILMNLIFVGLLLHLLNLVL